MNLDDALRCLFLRHLRADRLAALAAGEAGRAEALAALARALEVTRDREARQYHVRLAGTAHTWTIPEDEFAFYTRGDRQAPPGISAEDAVYEQNQTRARLWLDRFREACHA